METMVQREKLLMEQECSKLVNKNIIIFLLGKLVSLVGDAMYTFAIGLYVLSVTGSGTSFALTIVLGTIPRAILGPISGVVADRFDKKKMVVILDILSGVIVLGLVGASSFGGLKLIYIYTTTVLLNVANVFFDTSISSSIPLLVDKERLTKINSFSTGISSLAFIVGPAIGGLMFSLIDIKIFLIINGMSFIFSGISEMFLDFNAKDKIYGKEVAVDSVSMESKPSFWEDLIEGFKYIAKTKWIVSLIGAFAFANMFITMGIQIPIPYVMNRVWLFSGFQYGIAMATLPVGMMLAAIIIGFIPQAEKNFKRIVGGIGAFSIVLIGLGLAIKYLPMGLNNWGKLVIVAVLLISMAFGAAILNIPLMVTFQTQIPENMLGRVMGVIGTLATIMMPVGAILGGLLIDNITPWILPFICGIVMALITIGIFVNKEIRKI